MKTRTMVVLALAVVIGVAVGVAVRGPGTVGADMPQFSREVIEVILDPDEPPDEVTQIGFSPGEEEWEACGVITDETWKVSKVPTVGWQEPGFDDSNWPLAEVRSPVGQESGYTADMPCLPAVIWAPTPATFAYFRKVVPAGTADPGSIFVNADNACHLWINGEYVGAKIDWGASARFDITSYWRPGSSNLIAVKGIDGGDGGSAGFALASQPTMSNVLWRRVEVPGLRMMARPNLEIFVPTPDNRNWPAGSFAKLDAFDRAIPFSKEVSPYRPQPVFVRDAVLIPYTLESGAGSGRLFPDRAFLVLDFYD